MFRSLDRWLIAWLGRPRRPRRSPIRNVVLAVCDHFEPLHHTDQRGALQRLTRWRTGFGRVVGVMRDSAGRTPRHTLFYPIEQYRQDLLAEIAGLCAETGCEVEVHLHHDNDSPEGLRAALRTGISQLRSHGFLGHDPSGRVRFGFIHGNWALDDSDPRGRNCGVPDELGILREEGCYGDFTMPSAPHPTQARVVNRIYYAPDTPAPRSHDCGTPVASRQTVAFRDDVRHLLCVQGPLALNFRRRKFGVLPRIENADLTGANPPSALRLGLWLAQGIHVEGRPDTVFVKLHTHGALETNEAMFLGDSYAAFLADLARISAREGWRLWFATAREMVNVVHGIEAGHADEPGALRDFLVLPPPNLGA